ncbi:MAG: hypothetical protein N3C60_06155 [Calditerrivibrio sp.]|nr:hypothetical protein [Calditerrivibrio sp.]
MMRIFTLAIVIIMSTFILSCSQNTVKEDPSNQKTDKQASTMGTAQQKDNPVNPHGDTTMQAKQPKPIVVPNDVAKKFKFVNINVISLKDNKTITTKAEIGKETTVPNTNVKIYVEAYLPDFTMGTENITSASAEEKNPAVKVKITTKSNVHEGWIFKNFEIHKIEDPDYDFKLVGGLPN